MSTRIFVPLAFAAAALPLLTASPTIAQVLQGTPVDNLPIPVPATPRPAGTANTPSAVTQSPVDANPTPIPSDSGIPQDNSISARDARTLNPVLIPTDAELQNDLAAGRSLGETKQDFIDLLAPSRRPFQFKKGGILGEKRRATAVAAWVTPGTEARWRGLLEQRSFADSQQQQADFSALQQEIVSPQRTLTFIVEIGDLVQRKKHDPPVTKEQADEALAKLTGTRFVLSDEKGINYNPRDVVAPTQAVMRQEFYDSIAPSPDKLPGGALGAPATVTATRVVKRRDPYQDFAAFYTVTFDAYNADGTARINRDTRSVTLRVITPEDDKYAVFETTKIP
jgi:hypothetical protein